MSGRFPSNWKPLKYTRADYLKLDILRKRHGPILRRGGRAVFRQTVGEAPLEKRAASEKITGHASLEERIVFKELQRRKVPFSFQSSMVGGRQELGGMVADFIITDRQLVIRVQGTIWHTGAVSEARDKIQKAVIENMGYTVLDIWDWEIRNLDLFNDWMDRNLGEIINARYY